MIDEQRTPNFIGSTLEAYPTASMTNRFVVPPPGVTNTISSADETMFRNYNLTVSWARNLEECKEAVAPAVQRLIDNVVGSGYVAQPNTGDEGLNEELKAAWSEWTSDRALCDQDCDMTFAEMERRVFRRAIVDGDCFVIPTNEGRLQVIENQYCKNPNQAVNTATDKTFLGVRKINGRKAGYYFRTESDEDARYFPAYDKDGFPLVFAVYFGKRVNQSRGISAISITRDMANFLSEINFATLVKAKLGALYCLIEKDMQSAVGTPVARNAADANSERVALEPGTKIRAPSGKDIQLFTANVPNPEQFKHFEQTLSFICANLNIPPEIAMLDSSKSNFSALRATMTQSYLNYRAFQNEYKSRLHIPAYQHFARCLWALNPSLRHGEITDFVKVRFNTPGWEYLNPEQDAKAATESIRNGTKTWEIIANQVYGCSAQELHQQQITSAGKLIEMADAKAKELRQKLDVDVCWREVLDIAFLHALDVNENHTDELPKKEPDNSNDEARPANNNITEI